MRARCRPQEGLFGLREWIDEGFFPEGWEGPPDGLGVAPFKKRANASSSPWTAKVGSHVHACMGGMWKSVGWQKGRPGKCFCIIYVMLATVFFAAFRASLVQT